MAVEVVWVRSSVGAYGPGTERAPDALRDSGLIAILESGGVTVIDGPAVDGGTMSPDPSSPKAQSLGRVAEVGAMVRRCVRAVLERGNTPLVLGGDCTITLGVLAAAVDVDERTQLIYFDGDADLSTPAATRSGILDAMVLAHILDVDGVADELASLGSRRPLLAGSDVLLAGVEEDDLDAREATILSEHAVSVLPAASLRRSPAESAREAAAGLAAGRPVVLHFDVDAIDSIDCPLAHFPHFNTGVPLDSAAEALKSFSSYSGFAALVVTEANPFHDPLRVEVPRLARLLSSALSGL